MTTNTAPTTWQRVGGGIYVSGRYTIRRSLSSQSKPLWILRHNGRFVRVFDTLSDAKAGATWHAEGTHG